MSRSSMPPQLPPSVPPRPAPAQDGSTRYMEPAVDVGGPRTVPVTRPGAPAAQPAGTPMAGDPGNCPQSADLHPQPADPQRPTAEPLSLIHI